MADDKTEPGMGTKVASARRERGMTQEQLAGELRIKQASLSMIESGELDIGKDLKGRIEGWLESGKGARSKAARGPYRKTYSDGEVQYKRRSTLPNRE